jgi:hypothetical protein
MRTVRGIVATVLAAMTGAILGDLVSEEIRARLDRLPQALVSLAARRLPLDVREDLSEDWSVELNEILRGAEALPITRLYRGTRYALGRAHTAASIGRDVTAPTANEPSGIPNPQPFKVSGTLASSSAASSLPLPKASGRTWVASQLRWKSWTGVGS